MGQTAPTGALGSFRYRGLFYITSEYKLANMKRILVSAIAILLMTSPMAQAHSRVVSSNPAAGSTITKMPAAISFTANEELVKLNGKEISKISLVAADKSEVKLGAISANKLTISAPILQKIFKSGAYTINYRIISADGHPVSGTIKFKLA